MYVENKESSSSGSRIQFLGVASGIFAFLLALIPNLNYSVFAIFPGSMGIVLSFIGLYRAYKAKTAKNMIVTGLVFALIACAIATFEFYILEPLPS